MASAEKEFVYDPFSPEVMANPLPFYEVLREQHPVYYSEQYDTFFLSRFEDVLEFLSVVDGTFGTPEGTVIARDTLLHDNEGVAPPWPPTEPLISLQHGSPIYEEVRQAHGKELRPGSVARMEEFIRELARRRLDILVPRGRFDLTQQFGGIVSASVMCNLLHIPLEEAKYLLDTVNSTTTTESGGGLDFMGMFETCADILEPIVRARREEGPDGSWEGIDGMLGFDLDGRRLSDREVAYNLECVLIGGTETLPKVVAHGLMELWRHPDQLEEVRADLKTNCRVAFNEMNRFCGPAQWFGRTALADTEVAGTPVRAGQRVIYLLQSAARDPREFGDDADEFRWNRPIERELAFGYGQHFCIGVHVARLEGRVLLEEFLARVAEYEIDLENAVRAPSSFQWGWNPLPVKILAEAA